MATRADPRSDLAAAADCLLDAICRAGAVAIVDEKAVDALDAGVIGIGRIYDKAARKRRKERKSA